MRDCGRLWPDISVPEGKLVGIAIMGADALRKSSASFLSSGFSCRPVSHQGQGSDGSALAGTHSRKTGGMPAVLQLPREKPVIKPESFRSLILMSQSAS